MARVQFGRGTSSLYTSTAADIKTNMVYFDTDTKEIKINDVAFGFSKTDSETLADIKAQVEAFFKEDATVEGAIDTLKEIVEYINNNGGQTGDLITLINGAQNAANTAQSEVDALEKAVGSGFSENNSVAKQLAAVKETADGAVQNVSTGTTNGTISVDGTAVNVFGLKSAAYQESSAFDAAGTAQTLINGLDFNSGAQGTTVKVTVVQENGKIKNVSVDDSLAATAQSVTNETNRATAQENTIEAAVGLKADGTHQTTNGNYTSKASTIAGEIAALDTQVKTNATTIDTINGTATQANSFRKGDADTLQSAKSYAEGLLDWYEAN